MSHRVQVRSFLAQFGLTRIDEILQEVVRINSYFVSVLVDC